MGNQGAKKRLDQNAKRMRNLRIAFVIGVLAQLSVRGLALTRGTSIPSWLWVGTALSIAISWFTFSSIAAFAAPTWGKDGELVDGGADLSMGGMCGYYHDILYISVTSLLSSWFWMFYLLIPAYGLYKLLVLVGQLLCSFCVLLGQASKGEARESSQARAKFYRFADLK
ncbi:hypothetical protein DUNSADRAFT_9776 [Dunaliella salina]|uniref:Uncharacterized protein n=1 Tax=Dunaliella salina TaxID=3046 RepID=A0ABQ7GGR2_DUNSA|nr:hypothetical protein DUNSADRAFT_9776 [Dunaliella salina]|eukprot:KAF5833791.1 hypothetical protein DUNSADRAFT_9776 [Dunaliella salina]